MDSLTIQDIFCGMNDVLKDILDHAGVGFWIYNHQSDSTIWSPHTCSLLGCNDGDYPKTLSNWFALIHPEDQARVEAAMQSALHITNPLYEVQFRYQHGQGHWIWLHSRGRVIKRNPDGTPLIAAGITTDISQLKQAEEKLVASETRFSELVEHIPIGVYTFVGNSADGSKKFTFTNERHAQMIGVNRSDLLRDASVAFNAAIPEDRDRLLKANQDAYLSGKPFHFEGRFHVRGEVRWLSISAHRSLHSGAESQWDGVVTDITERKLAEEVIRTLNAQLEQKVLARTAELEATTHQLRASEDRLKHALDASNAGVWEWNLQTGQISDIRSSSPLLQCCPEGQDAFSLFDELVHREDREAFRAASQRLAMESGDIEMEYRLRFGDDHYHWVLARGQVVERDGEGVPLRAIGTFTDIESRKQIELQNRKLAAIVEASHDMIATSTPDGMIDYVNPALRSQLGFGENIPVDRIRIRDAHTDSDYRHVMEERIPIAIRDGSWQGDSSFLRQDGSEFEVSQHILAPKNPHTGNIDFLVTICRDITERKRLERDLLESQANFEQMANTVPVVLYKYLIHPDGSDRFVYVGGKCREILEFDESALMADSSQIWSIIIEEDRQRLYEQSLKSLSGGRQDFSEEVRIVTASGRLKWIQFYSRTSPSPIEDVPFWVGCILDISERKRLEQEICDRNDELEGADRRKTQFIATLAHELRNPLSPMLLMAELLKEGRLDPDQQNWSFDMIGRQTRHLAKLVDDLLDVSRISQGKINLDRRPILST